MCCIYINISDNKGQLLLISIIKFLAFFINSYYYFNCFRLVLVECRCNKIFIASRYINSINFKFHILFVHAQLQVKFRIFMHIHNICYFVHVYTRTFYKYENTEERNKLVRREIYRCIADRYLLRICTCEYIYIIRLHVFIFTYHGCCLYNMNSIIKIKIVIISRKRLYILRKKWKRKNENNNYY